MFHLAAFTAAQGISATPVALAGIQDTYLTLTAGNNYLVPTPLRLAFALAQGLSVSLAQVSTPSWRPISPVSIQPALQSATIANLAQIPFYGNNGPRVRSNEELSALTTSGNAAERQHVFVGLGDGNMNWDSGGEMFTIHGTMANVGAADVWTASALTLDQTLEPGNYRVVGMDIVGTRVFAARIIFPNGGMRPGCIGRPSFAIQPNMMFRNGGLGTWGTFPQTALPSIECMFSGGVGTTQDVFLDVQKV